MRKMEIVTGHKMWLNRVVIVFQVILVTFISYSNSYKYKAVVQDDDVFRKCENQPSNVLDVHGLFDLSELNTTPDFYKILISGNSTLVWDIQPSDRIQVKIQLYKFDRGSWQPTLYTISTPSFCPIMYDKNQYWYQSWLQHLTNLQEVKDKCLNVPGTKFMHRPFELEFLFETHLNNLSGLYKVEVSLKAFDMLNRIRPTSICFCFHLEYETVTVDGSLR